MVITIDGPAASGKSTAARLLAEQLGIAYLDTGAMYRAVTVAAMRRGVDLSDGRALGDAAAGIRIEMDPKGRFVRVDGDDVTSAIRENDVSRNAGRYTATNEGVRAVLVGEQRRIAGRWKDLVTEGRDQGSVVFPDAELKVYLHCSDEERARRRHLELRQRGENVSFEQVLEEIRQRDKSDRERMIGPLRPPDGSVNLDTDGKSIEETVDYLARLVHGTRQVG